MDLVVRTVGDRATLTCRRFHSERETLLSRGCRLLIFFFENFTDVVLSRFVLQLIAPALLLQLQYVPHVLTALGVAAVVHVHVLRRRYAVDVLVNLQNTIWPSTNGATVEPA